MLTLTRTGLTPLTEQSRSSPAWCANVPIKAKRPHQTLHNKRQLQNSQPASCWAFISKTAHCISLATLATTSPIAWIARTRCAKHMRHSQNYLLAAVSLLSLRARCHFPAFPSFSSGIVFWESPILCHGLVHFQSINETPNTKLKILTALYMVSLDSS